MVCVELIHGREAIFFITVAVRLSLLALFIKLVTCLECLIAVPAALTVALNDDAAFFVIAAILPPNFAIYGPRNAPSAAPAAVTPAINNAFFHPDSLIL